MKSIIVLFLAAGTLVSAHNVKPIIKSGKSAVTCIGANPCHACKN